MKILCLSIGKSHPEFVSSAVDNYHQRMRKYVDCQWRLLATVKNASKLPPQELKKKEADAFLKVIDSRDHVILLDEKGKSYHSRQFADQLQKFANLSIKRLVFVIGGAYGFGDQCYERADQKIRLSDMTFSHQIIRILFMEQLYRAYTIIHGDPYHND